MEAGLAGSGTSLSSYSGIKIGIFDPPINIARINGTKSCSLFVGCIGIESLLSTQSKNHIGSVKVYPKLRIFGCLNCSSQERHSQDTEHEDHGTEDGNSEFA